MKLEFTTTACNRPALLRDTYESFTANLKGVDFDASTVYINVDPAPHGDGVRRCAAVARDFFGTVVPNYPDNPSFGAAARWCWSQVRGAYFFNLEDDWNLEQPVHVEELLHTWSIAPGAVQVVLRHSPKHGPNARPDKPEYEHIHKPGLPPSLNSRARLREMIAQWDADQNPEKWFRHWYASHPDPGPVYMWPKSVITRDIGRAWRADRGLEKKRMEDRAPGQWVTWNG